MFTHSRVAVLFVVLISCDPVYTAEIIGGHVAVPHSRPYMVLVERHMSDGTKKYCGGSILSEDFVMTAAHCQAKDYLIYLGLHDMSLNDEVERITVEQAFPNIHYNNVTLMNDVMLLKLTSKARFGSKVKSINLASKNDKALPKSCIVSGWGGTKESNGLLSHKLMETNITLIENENCKVEKSYCSKGEPGPGLGDSGGPLVCEHGKAYGVVSSMFKPVENGPPLFRYAKIPDYNGWIMSTVKTALMRKNAHNRFQ
ncbi:granzyme E [Fundulus heteroclitus]|uniref:granzyme E n=1 Tax=Fundulus heteroclitus TaxID=8078 RepID=UPI00165AF438|nr:granzyme E [Fundulus heteroclitus]